MQGVLGAGFRGSRIRESECREVRVQGSGVQRVQGCRGHRGAGIRDARSVSHKGAELRVQRVQGSGVQRMQGTEVQGS